MLMIADETITGFRFGPDGAQKYLGFVPNLTILGKAIGTWCAVSMACTRWHLI